MLRAVTRGRSAAPPYRRSGYSVARRFIDDGHMPERDSVRLEEYVNSFDYEYEPPGDAAFAVHEESHMPGV